MSHKKERISQTHTVASICGLVLLMILDADNDMYHDFDVVADTKC